MNLNKTMEDQAYYWVHTGHGWLPAQYTAETELYEIMHLRDTYTETEFNQVGPKINRPNWRPV